MKEKLLFIIFIFSIIALAGCSLSNLFDLSFSFNVDPTVTSSPGESTLSTTTTPTHQKTTPTGNPSESTTISGVNSKDPTKTSTKPQIASTKTVTSKPTLTLEPTPSPDLSIEAPPTELRFQGSESIFGIHLDDWSSAAEKTVLEESGGTWSRFDGFRWDLLEPVRTDPPTYQWQAFNEDGLKNLTADSTTVIGIVLLSPDWAQKYPGIACGPFAEDALDRFGSFMQEIVYWYSQPPFNVKYWELGNEPDIYSASVLPDSGYGCWGEPDGEYFGGRYYADMLKIAYPRIKEADPDSHVLIGGCC